MKHPFAFSIRRSGFSDARAVAIVVAALLCLDRSAGQTCQNIAGVYSGSGRVVVSVTVQGQTQTDTFNPSGQETITQSGCTVSVTESVADYGSVTLVGQIQGSQIVFTSVNFHDLPSGLKITKQSVSGSGTISGGTITANVVIQISGTYYLVPFTGTETITGTLHRIGDLDTTPPSLAVSAPAHHATVAGGYVYVSGTATDAALGNSGITKVTVDGVSASNGTATGSGTAYWYASVYRPVGIHTLTVTATDGAGYSTSRSITISTDPAWHWHATYGWRWSAGNGWWYSSTFGWMWSSGEWTYSTMLLGWLGGSGASHTVWSPQFRWLTTAEDTDYRANTSAIGWVWIGKFQGAVIPEGWVVSDRFGYVWAAGDGVWFYSDRFGWLGVTPEGGVWCVDQGRFL